VEHLGKRKGIQRCASQKKLNSLRLTHLRIPFWERKQATFGPRSIHDGIAAIMAPYGCGAKSDAHTSSKGNSKVRKPKEIEFFMSYAPSNSLLGKETCDFWSNKYTGMESQQQ
jgi:hypothetical protein